MLAIAAAVTRGDPLPGETERREPGSVIFITFEDSPEDTLAVRAERIVWARI
jgi:RecA-family ATPase